MGIVFFFSLGFVGVAVLIGAARTARTFREALLFGMFGAVLMSLNCLVLKWAAGLQVGTNGDGRDYVWFYVAVFLTVAILLIYFAVAGKRLYNEHQSRKQRGSE